ncbi:hypothetical protein BFJ63_vAg3072 [Fusarium oxysporum f. sp. narcissi]|uniref:Uncharacterized protein n=3 Tax=Fusarium oxysporum TaxID=5507 RepID=A0A420QD72_FUSOX|nr:hypothetical protein BFJ65_g2280 [Fusarium oxysporum f. sp. cepae]RKK91379.1 hypothetical protein BFJ71_g10930 [Fusarium oxysporum]RYC94113.1 hypothetical protein BFJ63_vAg3072 [Fusarium oxysporum f. sp. narcissi]RKK61343.1 hypothetical protein BFJ66_g1472 [Fusarium oxysporum f. sp. cepae]RKK62004.1 hypothetical protein BFJ67_g1427 [Fusarium oxysporum f. sp. cepae]
MPNEARYPTQSKFHLCPSLLEDGPLLVSFSGQPEDEIQVIHHLLLDKLPRKATISMLHEATELKHIFLEGIPHFQHLSLVDA